MFVALGRRMARAETKLKTAPSDRITIWCANPVDFDETIDLLIAQGIFSEIDRERCIHWGEIKDASEIRHVDMIDILDTEEMLRDARAGVPPKSLILNYGPRKQPPVIEDDLT